MFFFNSHPCPETLAATTLRQLGQGPSSSAFASAVGGGGDPDLHCRVVVRTLRIIVLFPKDDVVHIRIKVSSTPGPSSVA